MDSTPAPDSAEQAGSITAATATVHMVVVGDKRSAVDDADDANADDGGRTKDVGPQRKRLRNGATYEVDMRKIAEIALVLSAMGTMRGGTEPSTVEKALMAEARTKLVGLCEDLAPKDIMQPEVFGGIIEDLGLSRFKDQQRLGFRPPKLSIVEKMDLSNRRMGESKPFTPPAALDSTQRAQNGRPLSSDKANHLPTSVGSFQQSSHISHASPTTSTTVSFQPPFSSSSSQVSVPAISTGLSNSNLGRDSSTAARVARPHLRSDGRVDGPSQAPQVTAGFVKPTTALLPRSIASSDMSTKDKLPDHLAMEIEGNATLHVPQVNSQTIHVQTLNSVTGQAVPGPLSSIRHTVQGMHFVHAATLMSHHPEISKIVQKIIHPKPAEHPAWNPSRDYMSKSLTCQMCKLLSNEIDSMLVCDACEKGFHLKCLQSCNQKFVPRGEWYCPKCMTISGGKPFPPKYGRVTRNMVATNISSNSAAVQSPEKKVETRDQNANQQKIVTNENHDEENASCGGTAVQSTEGEAIQRNEMHGGELSAIVKNEEVPITESCPDEEQQSMEASCISASSGSLENLPTEHTLKREAPQCKDEVKSEHKICTPDPPDLSTSDHLSVSNSHCNVDHAGALNGVGVLPEQNNYSDQLDNHSEKSDGWKTDECSQTRNFKENYQDIEQEKKIVLAGASTELQDPAQNSEDKYNADWIGNFHAVNNKKFYQSCCIDGVVYKLQDYALVQSSDGKLIPSKLQALWEDSQTGSRWVAANRCYFPDDLPATVGRPSGPERNEVYESNDESTLTVTLIKGPCDVLGTKIFGEMNKKGGEENGDRPIFLCRWLYDKFKGVFCPIPS